MAFMKQQSLIVLLLFCTSPTENKVVESVAECSEFFLQEKSPNIPEILVKGNILDQNRYKPICQTLANEKRFVTLYDTVNKIPVFSASKYRGHTDGRPQTPGHTDGRPQTGRPQTPWMIEPELESIKNDNMQPAKKPTYNFQAGPRDYINDQKLDKGHLLPSSYGHTYIDKKSTFTLTNIVPQVHMFNTKSWNHMEQCVKCVLDKYCTNNNNQKEGFVVIGAQPSNNRILNDKINIPKLLWSAFCCYSSSQNKWLAGAHWGENVEPQSDHLQTMSLEELHSKLGEEFDVFPETQCPLKTTVTEFYPQLEKKCKCPPPAPRTTTSTGTPVMTTPPTVTSILSTFITSTSGHPSTTSGNSATTSVPPSTATTSQGSTATFSVSATSHKGQNSASTSSYLPTSSERATTQILKDCMIRLDKYDPSQQLFLCIRRIQHLRRYCQVMKRSQQLFLCIRRIQHLRRYCQVMKRSKYFNTKVSRIYNPSSNYFNC